MMDSDDEAFENFIVTSDNEDSAKENTAPKQPRTNKRQYDLIESFAHRTDERTMSKESYDLLWDNLAGQLNEMGPPIRDSCGWRRAWSVYKYNRKRKHSESPRVSNRQSDQGQLLNDRPAEGQVPVPIITSYRPSDSPYQGQVDTSVGSSQLALSLQMLDKLNEILAVLKESNNLLKQLVASLSSK